MHGSPTPQLQPAWPKQCAEEQSVIHCKTPNEGVDCQNTLFFKIQVFVFFCSQKIISNTDCYRKHRAATLRSAHNKTQHQAALQNQGDNNMVRSGPSRPAARWRLYAGVTRRGGGSFDLPALVFTGAAQANATAPWPLLPGYMAGAWGFQGRYAVPPPGLSMKCGGSAVADRRLRRRRTVRRSHPTPLSRWHAGRRLT